MDADDEVIMVTADLDAVAERVIVLGYSERSLSLKGARAHLLGTGLAKLTTISNYWLARIMGSHVSMELTPFRVKSDDTIEDEIALNIRGMGDGGYKSCSRGQKRGLNIAFLLAIASVSEAIGQIELGTLWCDEVFDAMDKGIVANVCEVLREIARDRPIVVIAHNEQVIAELRPDWWYHVDAGGLTRVA